jgi:glutathione S-transferase kappa 1
MTKPLPVNFFFDVLSPYTYFAFVILARYKTFWNLRVTFRPFYLGGIMAGSSNTPPAMVPNRAIFLGEDLKRNVKFLGLENFLFMPPNFFSSEVNKVTMQMNRFLCLLVTRPEIPEDVKWRFVDECFGFFWTDKGNRNSDNEFVPKNNFLEIICDRVGANVGRDLINQVANEGKSMLADNTRAALELHAFGSPTFQFPNDEIFFGSDRFEQMAFLFGLEWRGPRGPNNVSKL